MRASGVIPWVLCISLRSEAGLTPFGGAGWGRSKQEATAGHQHYCSITRARTSGPRRMTFPKSFRNQRWNGCLSSRKHGFVPGKFLQTHCAQPLGGVAGHESEVVPALWVLSVHQTPTLCQTPSKNGVAYRGLPLCQERLPSSTLFHLIIADTN